MAQSAGYDPGGSGGAPVPQAPASQPGVQGAPTQAQTTPPGHAAPSQQEAYPPVPGAYPQPPQPAPGAYPPAPGYYPPPSASQHTVERPPAAEPEAAKPRTLAIGITTLKEHGFGGVVRGRMDHVALDFAVGFNPVLVIVSGDTSIVDFGMPLQLSLGPVFFFSSDQATFQNGIRLNGIYNRALGPGGGLGWVGEITKRHLTIAFGVGFQVYPQASRRVKEYFSDLRDQDVDLSSSLPELQVYVGVNILWYLI